MTKVLDPVFQRDDEHTEMTKKNLFSTPKEVETKSPTSFFIFIKIKLT